MFYSFAMVIRASTIGELSQALAKASATQTPVSAVDLHSLAGVLEYRPEDMTVTMQTGIPLQTLQAELARRGQWLPIDPPRAPTIDEVLNRNLSGPRRFGYATIREHLIGITAVLADGRIIHNGGKVVKNVAGFDLCKLFVGSQWSLGIVVEATFKLRPLPVRELFLSAQFDHISEAAKAIQRVLESPLTPVVLDLFSDRLPACSLVLGLAGTVEEVEWQKAEATKLEISTPASLDYDANFWSAATPPKQSSVLPSRLAEELVSRQPENFVARAGNGILFYRGGLEPPKPSVPATLTRRLKEIFDEKRILPDLVI